MVDAILITWLVALSCFVLCLSGDVRYIKWVIKAELLPSIEDTDTELDKQTARINKLVLSTPAGTAKALVEKDVNRLHPSDSQTSGEGRR